MALLHSGNGQQRLGTNLPGLDSSFAAIPRMPAGQTPQLADFAATAGTTKVCNYYRQREGYPLIMATKTWALHATG